MFEIYTKNYIAKVVVFNVLNAYEKTEETAALYKKACKQAKTDKITLDTAAEVKLWYKALDAYTPKNKENTVYNAMHKRANYVYDDIQDAEYLKWEMFCD